jgi:hypothetical protein
MLGYMNTILVGKCHMSMDVFRNAFPGMTGYMYNLDWSIVIGYSESNEVKAKKVQDES